MYQLKVTTAANPSDSVSGSSGTESEARNSTENGSSGKM